MSLHALPGRPPAANSLLVRCVNWIGDAVMTIPALRELRRHLPAAKITLMARPWVIGLLEEQDFFDDAVACASEGSALDRWQQDRRRLERGRYDAALLLPNAIGPALLAAAAGIPERWGYATDARQLLLTRSVPKGRALRGRHQCFHYLHLIRSLGLSPTSYLEDGPFRPEARLTRSATQSARAEETAARFGIFGTPRRPRVGIHAGASYGAAKRWFPERFGQVADGLFSRREAEIVFIGSAGERPLAEAIAGLAKYPVRILAGETSLTELLDLMSRMDLFLANDSGPMHLAAALDVPVLAIFGSTDPVATAPLCSRSILVRKETACSPCLLRECPLDLLCFDRISANEVLSQAETMLAETWKKRQTTV